MIQDVNYVIHMMMLKLTKVVKWYGKNYSSHIAAYNFESIYIITSRVHKCYKRSCCYKAPAYYTSMYSLLIILQCNLKFWHMLNIVLKNKYSAQSLYTSLHNISRQLNRLFYYWMVYYYSRVYDYFLQLSMNAHVSIVLHIFYNAGIMKMLSVTIMVKLT